MLRSPRIRFMRVSQVIWLFLFFCHVMDGANCLGHFIGEQNDRDILDAVGEYKCPDRMSVRNVPAVVNIKTVTGRCIAYKFNTGWSAGVVKNVDKKKSVAGQFVVKEQTGTLCWTKKLNQKDNGIRQVLLAVDKQ